MGMQREAISTYHPSLTTHGGTLSGLETCVPHFSSGVHPIPKKERNSHPRGSSWCVHVHNIAPTPLLFFF